MQKILRLFFVAMLCMMSHWAFAKTYGRILCQYPGFYCHKVKNGQSWHSLFKNNHDREIAMRINRMNTDLYPGLVIAIPDEISSTNIIDYAPFPSQMHTAEKLIIVDTKALAWAAYSADGMLVRWGPISAGRDWCDDVNESCETRQGTFRIFSLGSSDCYSSKFPLPKGGAPMPYCMYFHGGQALHGEPYGLPGYHASHGCVRLYVNDAEWLRYDFVEGPQENNRYQGTKIIVRALGDDNDNVGNSDNIENETPEQQEG